MAPNGRVEQSSYATSTMNHLDETRPFQPEACDTPVGQPAPAALPARIGRYRVERVLGAGGFGRVYLAQDEQLDRLVAIKVPHPQLLTRPADAESYLAE